MSHNFSISTKMVYKTCPWPLGLVRLTPHSSWTNECLHKFPCQWFLKQMQKTTTASSSCPISPTPWILEYMVPPDQNPAPHIYYLIRPYHPTSHPCSLDTTPSSTTYSLPLLPSLWRCQLGGHCFLYAITPSWETPMEYQSCFRAMWHRQNSPLLDLSMRCRLPTMFPAQGYHSCPPVPIPWCH